jgi:hypothetical protein
MTKFKKEVINGDVVFSDENKNSSSVEHFGSEQKAKDALHSLVGCICCINCFDCFGCSSCANCVECANCKNCTDCNGCYGCYGCSQCYSCFSLSRISDSSGISRYGAAKISNKTPFIKNIHAAIYSVCKVKKALDMDEFHTCKTTHCRAGWAIHLAGEKGYALEAKFGPVIAASMIYDASSNFKISPPRFFEKKKDAMADMKRLAELEAAQ